MLSVATRVVSHLTGLLAAVPIPIPLRSPYYRFYSWLFGVKLDEVERPLEDYRSLSAFFIRKLVPGSRPINGAVSCPVDALLFDAGQTDGKASFSAKGIDYRLSQILLFQSPELLAQNYRYFLFHLRPGDYHRVHAPVDGKLVEVAHAAGSLLPVNDLGRKYFPDLFCVNERLLLKFQTDLGTCYLAMFGALNVGSMFINGVDLSTNENPLIRTEPRLISLSELKFHRGDELGGFMMGSSVMLLVPTALDSFRANSAVPSNVQVGQSIFT